MCRRAAGIVNEAPIIVAVRLDRAESKAGEQPAASQAIASDCPLAVAGLGSYSGRRSASLGKAHSKVAQRASNHEADPTEPHWYRPSLDDNRPAHDKAQQMKQRNEREDCSGYGSKRFLRHGGIHF
jgi:hypothetical protein